MFVKLFILWISGNPECIVLDWSYNYDPVDLPDTFGLNWRDAIIRCLESVLSVQSTPRPADGEVTLAATCQSEPEEKTTVLTPW